MTKHLFNPKSWLLALAILVAASCATLLIEMKTAAAEGIVYHLITFDGRTEPAECHFEYTEPVTEICVSESFICTKYPETDQFNCTVKR